MSTKTVSGLGVLKLTALTAALAMAGCGGGGGDNSGSVASSSSSTSSSVTSSSSSSEPAGNSAPVVEAGDTVTVNAGEVVQLSATASDSDGEVQSVVWRQISGPRVPLDLVNGAQGAITFRAPSTGSSATADMVLEVTAKDDGGASVSDTTTVTVNRVNRAPVVDLGGLRALSNVQVVNLNATAYDTDGEIESYLWEQVAGQSVTVDGSTNKSASFSVPAFEDEARFEFMLTATDNDGAENSDRVTIVLTSEDAPVVDVAFPPSHSFTSQNSLSAFGSVEVLAGSEITEVVVDAGVAPVTATLNADGTWRADDVLLPDGVNEAKMTVTALDSSGRAGYAESEVVLNQDYNVGYGASWVQSKALVLQPDGESVWVITDGELDSDLNLLEIDLHTGRRSAVETDLGAPLFSDTTDSYEDFVYDEASGQFYLSSITYPEGDESDPVGKIFQIDAITGMRTELELSGLGEAQQLVTPTGLELVAPDELYVADQMSGRLFQVNIESSAAKIVFENEPESSDYNQPGQLAYDQNANRMLTTVGGSGFVSLFGVTLTDPAQLELVSDGPGVDFGPIPLGIAGGLSVNHDENIAYMISNLENGIVQVVLNDGSREVLAEGAFSSAADSHDVVFNPESGVIYVVEGEDYRQQLIAVDAVSGDAVVISKSSL